MRSIIHTKQCDERAAKNAVDHAAFIAQHPGVCQRCGGYEGFTTPGVRTFPNGDPGYPDDYDPCPFCVEANKCGLCGQDLGEYDFDAEVRPCGCSEVDTPARDAIGGLPPAHECFCGWMDIACPECRNGMARTTTGSQVLRCSECGHEENGEGH